MLLHKEGNAQSKRSKGIIFLVIYLFLLVIVNFPGSWRILSKISSLVNHLANTDVLHNPAMKRIFLIGFPGHGRNAGGHFISFNRNPFGMIVSSVDGNIFHANVERIPWEVDQYGGISGCPAFLISAGRANEIKLVGFAREVWMKQLMFTHARQLLPDGRIRRRFIVARGARDP